MATQVGFQLESMLTSKHLTDAEYIKGGYFVVAKYSDLAGYSVAKGSTDGTIVEGSLCYCQDDNKFYQYTGTAWKEATATTETAGLMSKDDKSKLNGIEAGAEVNVQSDWNATSGDAYIKNKPTIPTVNNAKLTLKVGNQTVSGNDAFTANDVTDTTYNVPSATASNYGVVKVSSVKTSAVTVNSASTDAERYYPVELNSDGKAIVNVPWENTVTSNVQSDWSTTNSDSASFIKNKPSALKNPNALNVKVNNETTSFTSYDGSSERTLTIKPSSTAGAFIISNGTTDKTIQLAGQFTDTDTNTTYSITTGDENGQIKVYPSDQTPYNVSVKGLKSAAYQESSAFAPANHGPHIELAGNGTATTAAKSDHNHSGLYLTDTEITDKINDRLVAIMRYKGTVATTAALPIENMENGDVYNVEQSCAASGTLPAVNAGDNVVWNEDQECWDVLGGTLDLSGYYTKTETNDLLDDKASTDHSHPITANAEDDDVVVLTGTQGTNAVTYKATHANSGVAAGTYKSVTVDQRGHITSGTNPTTLQGYGITDALPDTTHYAASDSTGGAATNINVTAQTPNGTSYYCLYSNGTSGSQGAKANADLYYTGGQGWTSFNVGKTSGNGILTLHRGSTAYGNLQTASLTAQRNYTFPDASGTVITTGNISDIPAASSAAPGLMSTAHFTKLDNLNFDNVGATETSVTLSEDLWLFAPVGAAQKAYNKELSTSPTASAISATNPAKIGTKGTTTLKGIFNTLFGQETKQNPTITKSVSLGFSSTAGTYGGSNTKIGTTVSEETVTYTITLNNEGSAQYGYKLKNGTNITDSYAKFYYPAKKCYSSNQAQLMLIFPDDISVDLTSSSCPITVIDKDDVFVAQDTTNHTLYFNFNSRKQVQFSLKLSQTTVPLSGSTIRANAIEAHVTLGAPQTTNSTIAEASTSTDKLIDSFLGYKPVSNVYETVTTAITASLSPKESNVISVGSGYIPYTWELATAAVSANGNLPTTHQQKNAYTNISITTADGTKNLYIYVPSGETIKEIKNNNQAAPSTWDTQSGTRSLKVNGVDATFHIYHVNAKVASGDNDFTITYS